MPNEEQALSAATPPKLAAKKEEEESEMDVEDGEARPGTAMMGMSALDMTSPSVGSGGWPRSLEDGDESGPRMVMRARKRSVGAGVRRPSPKSRCHYIGLLVKGRHYIYKSVVRRPGG
jgi:hypothetical protein